MTHDRVHGGGFELTHDSLAMMLGVRRAGTSVTMGALQSAGIVTYGITDLNAVARAYLESNGMISVIRADRGEPDDPPKPPAVG